MALAAITLVALAVRVLFAITVASDLPFGTDADYYYLTAKGLRSGDGFNLRPAFALWPSTDDPSVLEPAGNHVPLHTLVLTAGGVLGFTSWDAQRVFLAGFSTIGVVLVGLLGRRVGGSAVGLVAATIVAVHPLWFQYPGFLSSDATFTVTAPALILAGLVAARQRTLRSMAVMGVAGGLAVLTRSEAVLFVPLLVLPVALLAGRGIRFRAVAISTVATVAVVAPWLIWMHSTYGVWSLSLNGGGTIALANCPETYAGPQIGSVVCGFAALGIAADGLPPDLSAEEKAVAFDEAARDLGISYARENAERLPVVVAARLGRTIGVFHLSESVDFDRTIGAEPTFQKAGFAVNWVLLVLSAIGAMVLVHRRSRRVLLVLASGPAVAISTAVLIYGATRIRVSAEPAIAVGAAVALTAGIRRLRPLWSGDTGRETIAESPAPLAPVARVQAVARTASASSSLRRKVVPANPRCT